MQKLSLSLILLLHYMSIQAQWSKVSNENNPICISSRTQKNSKIISDGAGGAVIVWQDRRNGFDNDIYAQRINQKGIIQWELNGVVVTSANGDQENPTIVSDGNGGVYVTWEDSRNGKSNYDIFAQHIDSNGVVQWEIDGTQICGADKLQINPKIIQDNSNGVIITWEDGRNFTLDIYSQRVDGLGNSLWNNDGVVVCSENQNQFHISMVSDGTGGAIIAWEDNRSGTELDIYAQRINASGKTIWPPSSGRIISSASDNQFNLELVYDASGGAIIAWQDRRNGKDFDIYAQKISLAGIEKWKSNGLPICTATNNQLNVQLASDGNGGGMIIWQDLRNNTDYDIYFQKVSSSGLLNLASDGIVIATSQLEQFNPSILPDSKGGAYIAWQEKIINESTDIKAQRINSSGNAIWDKNGLYICNAVNEQENQKMIVDSSGGLIISWEDFRNFKDYDIYAQRVNSDGVLGPIVGVFDISNLIKVSISPNPSMDYINISIPESLYNNKTHKLIEIIDPTGRYVMQVNNATSYEQVDISSLPPGVYMIRIYQQHLLMYSMQFIKM